MSSIDLPCEDLEYIPQNIFSIPKAEEIRILTLDEVERDSNLVIKEVSELCDIPNFVSEGLLKYFGWDSERVVNSWFQSNENLLSKLNINFTVDTSRNILRADEKSFICPVTTEEVLMENTYSMSCGHRFSNDCWITYLKTALEEGGTCLTTGCPMYKCDHIVPHDVWYRFLDDKHQEKYNDYRRKSLINTNPCLVWCTSPECTLVIYKKLSKHVNSVVCQCGNKFCFSCREEPHDPIPCKIIEKWLIKNNSEAENMNWLLVHTKNCPKCKNSIEKNQGCMHMKCRCGHEFCWLCLLDWQKHDTLSYYICNIYSSIIPDVKLEESKKKAKQSIKRYIHYYERYRAHNIGQTFAKERQFPLIANHIETINKLFPFVISSQFLEDAIQQIIDCRRFLKWTYAFGYFIDWKEYTNERILFEYYQGELEKNSDRLQEMCEQFSPNSYTCSQAEEFLKFKTDLINFTRVVKGYFNNISKTFLSDFVRNSPKQIYNI